MEWCRIIPAIRHYRGYVELMIIGSGQPDPFRFNEFIAIPAPIGAGYNTTTGKTLQSSTSFTPASTKCIITGGQSNMTTSCGTVIYTTVSANAHQLNIYDGGIYLGSDPVLGCNFNTAAPSSINMRLADSVISRGKATSCVVIPVGIGGTKYGEWTPTASNTLYTRITTAILRARARGMEPDAIFWGEGETDATEGTSAASITASITAIVTALRAAPISWAGPFYVGYYTMVAGVINGGLGTGTVAGVRKGIFDSISAPLNIVGGFDADNNCPAAGRIDPPGTHLGDAQLATAATGWTTLAFP